MTDKRQSKDLPASIHNRLAALVNAIEFWAQSNTRPETVDREDKVKRRRLSAPFLFCWQASG
jgi:hypothetical protein